MNSKEIIESAVTWAITTAQDSHHGYDQAYRWGPDYDCSSFVITAWQNTGVPVKTNGASYTGNMKPVFIKCGFHDVTSQVNLATGYGLQRGDVLLNIRNHVEMYIGGGQNIKASINERGGITGGQTGDQTGREICIGGYYNYPWDCVLRYVGDGSDSKPTRSAQEQKHAEQVILTIGSEGAAVKKMQGDLIKLGYDLGKYKDDGSFGEDTLAAVLRFQADHNLETDGEAGPLTLAAIEKAMSTSQASTPKQPAATEKVFAAGDIVMFTGNTHYISANDVDAKACKAGKAKVTRVYGLGSSKHPYHVVAVAGGGSTVYGWVDAKDIKSV